MSHMLFFYAHKTLITRMKAVCDLLIDLLIVVYTEKQKMGIIQFIRVKNINLPIVSFPQ